MTPNVRTARIKYSDVLYAFSMYVLFYHASISGMCCIMKVMQKWLRDSLLVVSAIIIASCALLGVSTHSSSKVVEKTDCSAMCSSHGSQLPGGANVKSDDNDEKEPTPPLFGLTLERVNLSSFYLAPTAILLSIFYHQRKRLLSTQLRF